MHSALVYTCIFSMLSLGRSIPVPSETLKNMVKLQAETINARIQEHNEKLKLSHKLLIGDPELYPEVPVDKPIQGLGSIVDTLTIFQKVLHSLPKGHVSKLHTDVSTLQGYLEDMMSSMRCPLIKRANDKSLEAFLKENASHHITVGYMALDRLEKFMQQLIVSLDQLKTC
ncbi:leptin a [Triplophysa dalaica]|uniref:leptin a n=1 Tax=Triplophysa dalaica TaxID=1582913 RepID=UPI0024DFA005|nr:leptin a [Triplophysa dalaica]